MKIKRFKGFNESVENDEDLKSRFSENIIQIETTVSDQKVKEYH